MDALPNAVTRYQSDKERRAAILTPLAAAPHCSRADARAAATTLGLSERQVFNLVRRLRTSLAEPTSADAAGATGGRCQSRLLPETERAVQGIIDDLRQSADAKSPVYVIKEIQRSCRAQQLPVPSVSTIRRRLKDRGSNEVISTAATVELPTGRTLVEAGTPLRLTSGIDTDTRLLSLLYETVGIADGWHTFIDALAQSYPGGIGVLLVHDTGIRNGFAQAAGQVGIDQVIAYNRYYASINPWMTNLGKLPTGQVLPGEFLLPHADLLRTKFFSDFLRPAGLGSGLGLIVQRDVSRHMIVSVLYPHETAERDTDNVGRLQRLVPHLLRVAQLNRQLAALEARAAAATATAILDGLNTAMLVVNAGGRVVYMNTEAERIITAGDGPIIVRMALNAAHPNEGQALRQLVASALLVPQTITAAPGGVMRISRRSGRPPYEVLVAPISETTLGSGFSGPLAAVFVRDPAALITTPLEWLQSLYTLTKAEARLMQSLLAGDTLETIAERDGVSKETLRSQLKAVFGKTGTGRQTELIRLALRGMAAFQA